jgi:hypothetical protein
MRRKDVRGSQKGKPVREYKGNWTRIVSDFGLDIFRHNLNSTLRSSLSFGILVETL